MQTQTTDLSIKIQSTENATEIDQVLLIKNIALLPATEGKN